MRRAKTTLWTSRLSVCHVLVALYTCSCIGVIEEGKEERLSENSCKQMTHMMTIFLLDSFPSQTDCITAPVSVGGERPDLKVIIQDNLGQVNNTCYSCSSSPGRACTTSVPRMYPHRLPDKAISAYNHAFTGLMLPEQEPHCLPCLTFTLRGSS